MDLKFINIMKSFFPKGRIWEFQKNFSDLIDGMSVEFGRSYDNTKAFYEDFNILDTSNLAVEHSKDYLIKQGLYTNNELQRIIVEYLNKDFNFKDIIEDFAIFIGSPITWEKAAPAIEFGIFEFGQEFGDADVSQTMQLVIKFPDDVTCSQYQKIVYLVGFLQPPYLEIFFTSPPAQTLIPFEFGVSVFGDEFGGITSC